jgi:hypothetical protein
VEFDDYRISISMGTRRPTHKRSRTPRRRSSEGRSVSNAGSWTPSSSTRGPSPKRSRRNSTPREPRSRYRQPTPGPCRGWAGDIPPLAGWLRLTGN